MMLLLREQQQPAIDEAIMVGRPGQQQHGLLACAVDGSGAI